MELARWSKLIKIHTHHGAAELLASQQLVENNVISMMMIIDYDILPMSQ